MDGGNLRALVRLARPQFLLGGFLFFALGAALARSGGAALGPWGYAAGQAFVTATQLGVHFGNEFHDLDADRANPSPTRLAGGSRVLVEGRLPPGAAIAASRGCFAAAAAAAPALLALGGAPAGAIAAAILLLSWGYSAPPLRLHSTGWGEAAAGLVVAGLVPTLAASLAGAGPDGRLALALAPGVLLTASLVTALSLPDREGDAAAGKRTLAVRLGEAGAVRAAQAACAAAAALAASLAWAWHPWWWLGAAGALTLAVALPVGVRFREWDELAVAAAAVVALDCIAAVLASA